MTYRVEITAPSRRSIRALARPVQVRIIRALEALAEAPRPHGCMKMAGPGDLYRIWVGEWRIVYAVEDDRLVVLVVRVGHRGDVYRAR